MVHRSESELNFDNIIFADRNQSYGAYDIRNAYNSHLKMAVIIAFFAFSAILLSPKIINLFAGGEEIIVCEFPSGIIEFTEVVSPPTNITTPTVSSRGAEVPTRIVPNDVTIPPTNNTTPIGTGNDPGPVVSIVGPIGPVVGDVPPSNSPVVSLPPPVAVVKAAVNPEFEGYLPFLRKNLNFPEKAREMGIQGKVYIEFIIERDGSITDVKVVKGIPHGFNEEAKRVIEMTSGKWSIAKDEKGVPVRFKKTLAIDFKLDTQQ